jgi:glycolate oxidase
MCDRNDKEAVRRAREAVRETFAVAIDLGGTISGEHGIGYVKAPYLGMAMTAATIESMKRIKRALDPLGVLNPGKMFV